VLAPFAKFSRREFLALSAVSTLGGAENWVSLFDGTSLTNWKESPFRGHGSVTVRDGCIDLARGERMTGITWTGPEFPQSGYEIRFDALKVEGKDFFSALTFPVGKSFCTWVNGGWGGQTVGLSSLDHMDASENETSTERDFAVGRWYRFRLRLAEERIQAWIDDAVVIEVDIKGRNVGLRADDTELTAPLGFSTYKTTARLRKIEYRLV
jgi:hypothetical protein